MFRYLAAAATAAFLLIFAQDLCAQTARPIPEIDHMIIVSIDGGRPDLILRGNCPAIRSLMAVGSYTFWARTTAVSITLPSHVSMLTGVTPLKHGVMWNEDLDFKEPFYPRFPTIFELAHKAGYSTALVAGKSKFRIFLKPGDVDFATVNEPRSAGEITSDAETILREHQPNILFVHFPTTDVVGHAVGWGTPEYMTELEATDTGIGRLLKALDDLKLRDHTVVLVTADHGGAGRSHGPDDPRSRHIPWIIAGPGIRQNFDLTLHPELEVNTEDTFATACYFFALRPRIDIDGKPILDILANRQLLGGK